MLTSDIVYLEDDLFEELRNTDCPRDNRLGWEGLNCGTNILSFLRITYGNEGGQVLGSGQSIQLGRLCREEARIVKSRTTVGPHSVRNLHFQV